MLNKISAHGSRAPMLLEPVSYTHLDVYKRQPRTPTPDLYVVTTLNPVHLKIRTRYIAVSYTHLLYGGSLSALAELTFLLLLSGCLACPTTYHRGDMQPIKIIKKAFK